MLKRATRLLTDPIKAVRTLGHLHRHLGVPLHHALGDYLRFRVRLGAGRGDFFFGRLWDRQLTLEERLRFLCYRDRVRLQRYLCSKEDQVLARDKAQAAGILQAAGIPGPNVLAVVSPATDRPRSGVVIHSEAQLRAFLSAPHATGLVFKPASGTGGNDVHIFRSVGPEVLTAMNGESWTVDRLWVILAKPPSIASFINVANDWLIEPRTPPHPTLAKIHGDTLGCVRVVAMLFADGNVGLLPPIWKIPVGNSGIDNLKFGSLFAPVDLDTGRTGQAIDQPTMMPVDVHPDTGAPLTGITLPDWQDALTVSRRAQLAFPEIRSLGFDVGLTEAGPRIVECNVGWDIWAMQAPHRRGVVQGDFLRFMEELGAEDVIRRRDRRLP